MAKDLAREIGYIYIDSGAMYRAVTLYSLQKGFFTERGIDTEALKTAMPDIHISFRLNPETQRPMTFLNDTNVEDAIRSMEVSSHVSPIAALGFVREALVKQQQEMATAAPATASMTVPSASSICSVSGICSTAWMKRRISNF